MLHLVQHSCFLVSCKCLLYKIQVVSLTLVPGLVYTVPFFACFLLIPSSLTVVTLIVAFCYTGANIVSEHAASLRPLLTFSTFLLLGNLLSAIGKSTPVIAAYVGSPTTEVIEQMAQSFSYPYRIFFTDISQNIRGTAMRDSVSYFTV